MITLIFGAIVGMAMETMYAFMEIPPSCLLCDNSTSVDAKDCVCEHTPVAPLTNFSNFLYYTFSVEYIMRLICFSPLPKSSGGPPTSVFNQFVMFVIHPWQVIDLLAVLPFWLEFLVDMRTLSALRILRLSRVFQVVKLGKYNRTFVTFARVMKKSTPALNLLFVILFFGMCLFGSLIYEYERGNWKYTEITDPPSWQYVRFSSDGVTEEISPFTSIPAACWWFIVTATTVGYGDIFPTSVYGKLIAGVTIVLSLLVVAFPISVFTNLWEEEFGIRGDELNQRATNRGVSLYSPAPSLRHSRVQSRVTFREDAIAAVAESSEGRGGDGIGKDVEEEIRKLLGVIDEARSEIERLLDPNMER